MSINSQFAHARAMCYYLYSFTESNLQENSVMVAKLMQLTGIQSQNITAIKISWIRKHTHVYLPDLGFSTDIAPEICNNSWHCLIFAIADHLPWGIRNLQRSGCKIQNKSNMLLSKDIQRTYFANLKHNPLYHE